MIELVKVCPRCQSERPVDEASCENLLPDNKTCGWFLVDEPLRRKGWLPPEPVPVSSLPQANAASTCPNGHPIEAGDTICLECGAEITGQTEPACETGADRARVPTEIGGWALDAGAPLESGAWTRWECIGQDGVRALLTLYEPGAEPDPAVHQLLREMERDHIPALLATGRWNDRAYEITELISGASLREAGFFAAGSPELLQRLADELGRALARFAELGLRHRDLTPDTILLRSTDPVDLVITGFGSARLSDFDLDAVAPLELTRYSAPEVIVGAVSAASDWWSAGIILLEHITRGECFNGVNEKAFQIHVVTRGVTIPKDIDSAQRLLLRGLLARDPLKRWQWPQVKAWLAGDPVQAPADTAAAVESGDGPGIELSGDSFHRPENYALAAAEARNWEAARALLQRGAVVTWLEERGESALVAAVRRVTTDQEASEDMRHSLALMALNPALPLTVGGEIVTPAWLLAHPEEGYAIVTGAVSRHLERMGREPWLVRLRTRAQAVRERAAQLEVEMDEPRTRVALLASSRSNLEAERTALRKIYPDSDHSGVASLIEDVRLSDEELIVLVSAAHHQFIPLASLLDSTRELARKSGVEGCDAGVAAALFMRPRREIYAEVESRIAGFAQSPILRVNEWADSFRIERRMPLPRAAVLLAMPRSAWIEPPKQQYIANLLEYFEKRVLHSVQRGPLVRFLIGKTTPRVDVFELGTSLRPAEATLDHLLKRGETAIHVDPAAFVANEAVLPRLRRLVSHALAFRRDTGIDGRYLGFPFLLIKDERLISPDAKPRIAPVLLWPVAIELPPGAVANASWMFDREREEVRLNPALEGLLGSVELERWRDARDELLGRAGIRVADVMDVFGALAAPLGRTLAPVPGKDTAISDGMRALSCSAALFNAEFTGQAIAEDLRSLRRMPPGGTSLDAALRVSAESSESSPARIPEPHDQYLTVESDPSQERAVAMARMTPGLLVEGPPGTGKSQTIVNIIADCIGRRETVLVVCQKQAALRVVQKRLEAEGLGDRLFSIIDVNKDREPILRALREQVQHVRRAPSGEIQALRQQRAAAAARVSTLETEINSHHESLYAPDALTGLNYRAILGRLIGMERNGITTSMNGSQAPVPAVPALRARLAEMDRGRMAELEETCAPLAQLWLRSHFEKSPLAALRSFSADDATTGEVRRLFSTFMAAEAKRAEVQTAQSASFEIDDPVPYCKWITEQEPLFLAMPAAAHGDAGKWINLFAARTGDSSAGEETMKRLANTIEALDGLDDADTDADLLAVVAVQPMEDVTLWAAIAPDAVAQVSFLGRLSPVRWIKRAGYKGYITRLGMEPTEERMAAMRHTLALEIQLRPLRAELESARKLLGRRNKARLITRDQVATEAKALLAALEPARAAIETVMAIPCLKEAEAMLKAGSREAYAAFRRNIDAAIARQAARVVSSAALAGLEPWFTESWIAERRAGIAQAKPPIPALAAIDAALPALDPYQRFRARAAQLDPAALMVFAALREHEETLEAVPVAALEEVVRYIVSREALLGWKGRIEQSCPSLLLEREEIERKVAGLSTADSELREINRNLLARDIDSAQLGSAREWEAITRLRGPRSRRLREIIDKGADIGITTLRPVWLMNPDTVSRVLPLRAAQFDVVIHDEASQMLVEHATPSLFRAKRVVISGDEKQMPPSSFFSKRADRDEDEEFDGSEPEESASDREREIYEETWNRRDIKDCPDLLALGRGSLPDTMLQIHYRSKYRELIGFSNSAFYEARLSVPARHPDAEIQKIRPIEVIRVDGLYEGQTNEPEAERVVQLLAEIWSGPTETCPSIGVVTFNLKQSDLIEDAIQQRAAADPAFLNAYRRELERIQRDEDMSFFVKNLENVQGDERDVILFSTTFGRDRAGSFKRFFGVLGQAGGERRLNVAVTRAREKVILVTSMPINDISDMLAASRKPDRPRDYLQAYVDYATRVSAGEPAAARASLQRLWPRQATRAADGFVADGFVAAVADYVSGLGYTPVAASDGDAFGIDLAIEDTSTGHFGIGIECDSPRDREGHLAAARAREIWRQNVMRRAIPVIHRVSSRAWVHNREEEQRRLRDAVEAALGWRK